MRMRLRPWFLRNLRLEVDCLLECGGSRENCLRFLKELVVPSRPRSGRIGRPSDWRRFLTAHGMACPDILPAILEAADFLQAQGVRYLHLVEADWDDAPQFTESFPKEIRARFRRPIIVAGHYDLDKANWLLDSATLISWPSVAHSSPTLIFPIAWPTAFRLPRSMAPPLWRRRARLQSLSNGARSGLTLNDPRRRP
jgi:hypothetical protein